MKVSTALRLLASAFILSFAMPVLVRAQGRIEGQIVNGTTGQPLVNQQVRLLLPRGGMEQLATASTDADGRFAFDQREIDPGSLYLVETEFQGVNYHAPARFDSAGKATANLTVYDSAHSDSGIRIQSLRILLRAQGAKLRIQEEYALLNPSEPPRAFTNSGGTFHFHVSGTEQPGVAVRGLMNMPLPQTPEPARSAGDFFIRYPLKPGVTTVTVAYDTDYASRQFALSDRVFYPVDRAELYVLPSTLSVSSEVLKPAGVDNTNDVQKFEAENLPRGAALALRLAGDAPATSEPENSPTGENSGPEVKVVPNSMTKLAAPLLLCFLLVLMWALGIRVAREWPKWQERRKQSPARKQFEAKVDGLFNSLADLDELFASGKIAENKYWKERLELKARLAAVLKKAPPSLLESYATRQTGS